MPDTDTRTRMISLRLSDEEYNALKTRYRTYGARNVSDLARLALQRIMSAGPEAQNGVADKLADLDHRVHSLESQFLLLVRAAVD